MSYFETMVPRTVDDMFNEFKSEYPKRLGSQSWTVARKKFDKALKEVDGDTLVWAAKLYGNECRRLGRWGTQFVVMAATFMNQERWREYPKPKITPVKTQWVLTDDPQWHALAYRWMAKKGKRPPSVPGLGGMGWSFPVSWLSKEGSGDSTKPSASAEQVCIR
jgi:hypothetical protein